MNADLRGLISSSPEYFFLVYVLFRHPYRQRNQAEEVCEPYIGAGMSEVNGDPLSAAHDDSRVVAIEVQQSAGEVATGGYGEPRKFFDQLDGLHLALCRNQAAALSHNVNDVDHHPEQS